MANIDLSTIWNTVKTATAAAGSSTLSQSSLTDIAKSVVTSAISGMGSKSGSNNSSSIDYVSIAKQLLTLYNQYKGSSDNTEKTAATNVKSISDIIGAMGGDKSSIISAGASILGSVLGGKSDSSSNKKDEGGLGSVLGSIFGK